MTPTPTLVEKMAYAWTVERSRWILVLRVREPSEVNLAGSNEDPFYGSATDCSDFMNKHCARAALAVVMAEVKAISPGMNEAGYRAIGETHYHTALDGRDIASQGWGEQAQHVFGAMLAAFEKENAG